MSIAEPRLRRDLVISRQEIAGRTALVVKDPATGQFFRLKEVEAYIVEQLDGGTPLEVVRQRVEERFAAPLPPDTFHQFLTSLSRLRLLEAEPSGPVPFPHQSRRPRSLFYLRLKLFDPDRLFTLLVGRMRVLFTPHFLFLSGSLILVALSA